MTKSSNIAAIEKATGRSWDEWLQFFESIGAKDLSHQKIAEKVHESGVPGWWSQSVTVAYEQHIGRRVPGQVASGKFQVSVSKTVEGTMDEALERFVHQTTDLKDFDGIEITRGPETSSSEKWRYWHCGLADGSRISVGIYQKAEDKAGVGIGHDNLLHAKDIERWRDFWKSFLEKL